MVNAGVQTDTLLEDKFIQSVAIEEEMFQLQHPPKLNTLLGIFLEKYTPKYLYIIYIFLSDQLFVFT